MSTHSSAWKPFGLALKAYEEGNRDAYLNVITEDGESSPMKIDLFFRSEEELPEIELKALELCKGKTLDIGAGAGSHALALQEQGKEVFAIDVSKEAAELMRKRGLKRVAQIDFLSLKEEQQFDTLLFLMNGIGIAGTLGQLPNYLKQAKRLCRKNGQIILDSSDPAYFDAKQQSITKMGSVNYQLSFKTETGKPYDWLYLGFEKLAEEALKVGLKAELLLQEEDGSYLARLLEI
ncbi:MAG: class I SAM-dependent methyltransferase [Vicingaceae bacterium]